jgi:hypothetical protein
MYLLLIFRCCLKPSFRTFEIARFSHCYGQCKTQGCKSTCFCFGVSAMIHLTASVATLDEDTLFARCATTACAAALMIISMFSSTSCHVMHCMLATTAPWAAPSNSSSSSHPRSHSLPRPRNMNIAHWHSSWHSFHRRQILDKLHQLHRRCIYQRQLNGRLFLKNNTRTGESLRSVAAGRPRGGFTPCGPELV